MRTKKLFEYDSFVKEFTATIIECKKTKEGYAILLDQTGFFPEGGGQTADSGVLSIDYVGDVEVLDVQEVDGEILHMTDTDVPVGTTVRGTLNWRERFSKMQHHSGEHIVSGLVNKRFGFNNVGFHLGSQVVTLDFDGVLTKEQLRQIEYEANEAVAADIPILARFPEKKELATLQYRSKIEIDGPVRIVEIPGYDTCACCAPHLKSTGQIGMIKLVNMHNYKGGVRVYMLCGFAALADYNEKAESVQTIALSMCTKENQVVEAMERLKDEIYRQKGAIMALTNQLLDYKVAAIESDSEKAVFIEEGLEGNQPRELANKILEKNVGLAAVFAGNDKDGYRYVLGSKTQDVRELAKEMNGALHGRGGGKPEMVQGTVACTSEEICGFFGEA